MKLRKVMIGTPCYDGRLDVWYVNSLMNTIKKASTRNIDIQPIWVSFDALLQKARNDTIELALSSDFDDLIWIDSDIEWDPEWIFTLLDYDVDVVGGTYPKKGDKEEYVYRPIDDVPFEPDPVTGLIEVLGLGTGFVKWSRKAIQYLWDSSEMYIETKDNRERRFIFDVVVKNNNLISEDIYAFMKLREGGFKIYLDPNMTCNHTGPKKWQGDFKQFYKNGFKPTWENSDRLEKISELAKYSISDRPNIKQYLQNKQPIVAPLRQPNHLLQTTPRRQL